MGKRGPKPKPSYLRVLEGNPGHRPFNPNESAVPVVGTLPSPEWFEPPMRDIWDEVCADLSKMGGLSTVDRRMLQEYVLTLFESEKLARKMHDMGDAIVTVNDKDGNPREVRSSPYFTQLMQLRMMALRFANHFGMTPSARARIVFLGNDGKPKDEGDPFAV